MIDPNLPLETELRLDNLRRHLGELSREELEENLYETTRQMVRLTHLCKQLLNQFNGNL